MRASHPSLQRSLLLSVALAPTLFSAGVLAQDDTTSETSTTSTDSDTTTATSTTATDTTATSSDDATSSMPTISDSTTTSTSATGTGSDMPTLSSTSSANTAIPTYPAASVPPTSNAPYMQTSNLPDGTVFITVGAILGAFGLALLVWRAVIACLLHRSVEKAAMAQHIANDKSSQFPLAPAPFYKYSDRDSSPNVASGRGVRRTNRGPIPSSTPSQTNLFFSPTAAAGANPRDSMYRDASNRDSTYRDSRFLPAGFYAAGASSPQNLDGANGSSISLNNLRPGHARGMSGYTPPESPGLNPQRSPLPRDVNSSSANVNSGSNARAPSAYLDDLLGDHPELFPPAGSGIDSNKPPPANQFYRQNGRF